jgi:hypothetical protein
MTTRGTLLQENPSLLIFSEAARDFMLSVAPSAGLEPPGVRCALALRRTGARAPLWSALVGSASGPRSGSP